MSLIEHIAVYLKMLRRSEQEYFESERKAKMKNPNKSEYKLAEFNLEKEKNDDFNGNDDNDADVKVIKYF